MKVLPQDLQVTTIDELVPGDFYTIVSTTSRLLTCGFIVRGRNLANRRIEKRGGEWVSTSLRENQESPAVRCIRIPANGPLKIKLPENPRSAGPLEQSGILMLTPDDVVMLVRVGEDRISQVSLRTWSSFDFDPRMDLVRFDTWQLVDEMCGAKDVVFVDISPVQPS